MKPKKVVDPVAKPKIQLGKLKAIAPKVKTVAKATGSKFGLTMKKWTKGGLDWEYVNTNHSPNDFNQCKLN